MSRDRTYNSKWYTNDKRKEHCLSIAEDGEELFRTLTGAIQGTFNEDLSHIDCFWNGKAVDVKGLKPMHSKGYVLIEMINTWGTTGWCAKNSKAEYIAFQFPEYFIIVSKQDLRELTILLCPPFNEQEVYRKNFIKPSEGLYKWVGRDFKKDIFTYITLEDLKTIKHEILNYATTRT